MGGDGRNADGARGISSQDHETDCGDDSEEGHQQGMGVGLGGYGIGYHGYLANKVVRKESEGKNHGICSRETNIKTLYRRKSCGGLQ